MAPWLDPQTGGQAIVVIDHRGQCIHMMAQDESETEEEALIRAQALLDLLDTPAQLADGSG